MLRQLISGLIAVLWLFPACVMAESVEVSVSEVAENAIIAKQKAIQSAEQQAFELFVTKHAPTQAEKILQLYTPDQRSAFVGGYEVVTEEMTDRTYRATMKVDVNDKAIAGLMETVKQAEAPIPLTLAERRDGAILVLPVTKDASGIVLWESDNRWREAMNATALQRGFNRLVMPYGDPTDRLMIDAGNVTTAGYPLLSGIARRYGASDILVAVMQPSIDKPNEQLQVDLRFVGVDGTKRQLITVNAEDPKEGLPALLNRAAVKIVDGLSKQAEMQRRMANGEKPMTRGTLNAVLALNNVGDWAELQQRLQAVQSVESFDLLSADWRQVTLALNYVGSPELLGQQLASANIHVQHEVDKLRLAIR